MKPSTGRALLRWVVWEQRRGVVAGMFAGVAWMGARAALPAVLAVTIQRGIVEDDTRALAAWIGVLAAVGLVEGVSGAVRHWFAIRNGSRTQNLVLERVFGHALDLDATFHSRVPAGDIVSRATSDAYHVGQLVDVTARGTGAVVTFVVVAAVLVLVSPVLAAWVVLGLPPLMLGTWWVAGRLRGRQAALQADLADAATEVSDTVVGLRVVKGLGAETAFRHRFDRVVERVRASGVAQGRIVAILEPLGPAVPGLVLLGVVWWGGTLAVQGRLDVGELVAFYAFVLFLITPIQTFNEVATKWAQAVAAADRLAGVMSAEAVVVAPDDARTPEREPDGELRCDGVVFRYVAGGAPVFDGLDLVVPAGTRLGVAARSGAGASTLCALLGRHLDPEAGRVRLDGVDLRELPLDWLRTHVVVADQHAFMFEASLRFNLTASDPAAGDERLAAVTRVTAADEIVAAVPGGLEGHLGERGRSLSGGQRQRVALARALLREPAVLVLDGPTDALDAATEHRVVGGLLEDRAGKTTVVVSTRRAVLAAMDRVVLLDRGRVAAAGTHGELLEREPAYRRLVAPDDPPVGTSEVA